MSAGSILFGYVLVKYEKEIMFKNLTNYVRFSTDLIKRGLHYGMLTAQREVIQETIEELGAREDVLHIRIFDKNGRVAYASNKSEIGLKIEKDATMLEVLKGKESFPQIITDPDGSKEVKLLTPIFNEPSCYKASCHYHPETEPVLGVLQTNFSAREIEAASRQSLIGTLLFGVVFVVLISVFLCIILYKFVSKPVALMEEGMKRLAKGDFDHPIEINTKDEMGLLARTFNSMAQDIKRYREHMEDWTKALQAEVEKKTAEIMKAQEQLIDAEKLASLGRMAAGIAHELNSPLTGIVTFAHLMRKRIPPDNKQDAEDLDVIIEQANRCSKIIKGLLGFARKGTSEKIQISINDLLESSIAMVKNQAKFHNIQLAINLAEKLPSVIADPNQIQQVFLNMLTNAADAMNDVGTIKIITRTVTDETDPSKQYVEIEFTDTGPGIPPEHMNKIFEPFFTTKPVGKGTGLGLPVSYGIVKRHGGDIIAKSEPGKGATFLIRLPVAEPEHKSTQEGK